MNINPITVKKLYSAGAVKDTSVTPSADRTIVPAGEKRDVISISAQASAQKELTKINAEIAKNVKEAGNSAKLEKLREQIQNNTYRIPTEQISEAILQSML